VITTIWQGGVQEVLRLDPAKPNELVLYVKERKGFIKLALTTGSPVVPVFAFNLDGSYGYWLPRGQFVEKISRAVGFAPLVFWGRWGIPFGIPHPRKSHVVIGQGERNVLTQYY
jgi:2-acylglycerol O-acyltransferase 2